MRVTWEIHDGYVGKSAPHYTEVDDGELEDCDSEEERNEVIKECVQEDFSQRISFVITNK